MPTRLTHPDGAPEPVTVAAAKLAANIDADITVWDSDIATLITTAREQAEHITGRTYRTTIWREELADWPAITDAVRVHGATAVAASYWNGSAWVNMAPNSVDFAPGGIGGCGTCVAPAAGSWPVLGERALGPRVRIDITAGPALPAEEGDPVAVPGVVDRYIKAQVTAWHRSGDALARGNLQPNPLFERLLDSETLWV